MKITLQEHEGCFAFGCQAETVAEAALLVRFGMNTTGKVRYHSADVHQDGTFTAGCVLAKHKRANSGVPKRR